MTNKYSEGYPGARYYAGNQYIDENERYVLVRVGVVVVVVVVDVVVVCSLHCIQSPNTLVVGIHSTC